MEGFKKRLQEALEEGKKVKLIFQYPASPRAIIKRGKVKATYEDSFEFNEIRDGLCSYAYKFLVEITEENETGYSYM